MPRRPNSSATQDPCIPAPNIATSLNSLVMDLQSAEDSTPRLETLWVLSEPPPMRGAEYGHRALRSAFYHSWHRLWRRTAAGLCTLVSGTRRRRASLNRHRQLITLHRQRAFQVIERDCCDNVGDAPETRHQGRARHCG
jgi:hypothetical protein